MQLPASLLLAATLLALPQHAIAAKKCGNIRAHCSKSASKYCSQVIGTYTSTVIASTVTVLGGPCATTYTNNKRAAQATPTQPSCLKSGCVTAACSSLGYTTATATVTVTSTPKATATAFELSLFPDGDDTQYAAQVDEADDSVDTYFYAGQSRQAYTLVAADGVDGECRLYEQNADGRGLYAATDSAERGTSTIFWYSDGDTTNDQALLCNVNVFSFGSTLFCYYGNKEYYSTGDQYGPWQISDNSRASQYSFDNAFVYPVV